jgi:hypothetical protein
MAIELSESAIAEEEFFTPEDAASFEQFVAKELAGRLVEVSPEDVEREKILWRGHSPHDVVGLLSGHVPEIILDNQFVTLHKDRAISYNRGGQGIRYNIAIGFMPPDEWQSRPAEELIASDLRSSKTIMDYQRGNFEATGHIHPQDVRFIAVRPHGGPGNSPGPVHYYKVLN